MNTQYSFSFTGKVGIYPGKGAWHFLAVPEKYSAQISKMKTSKKDSWGFIYIETTIGTTTWNTSLWPKSKEGVYLLLITAPVRKREGIFAGDIVRAEVHVLKRQSKTRG